MIARGAMTGIHHGAAGNPFVFIRHPAFICG
jgi:hypothetical protein